MQWEQGAPEQPGLTRNYTVSHCGHALSRDHAMFGKARDRVPVELSQAEGHRSGSGWDARRIQA